ncbi:MAG: methyl-accepting chemotaxis protein [Lachnospiraceae bacterium]|nr:methyl-accepting chemotaxis protein [Lachnospiraceae bacterium]
MKSIKGKIIVSIILCTLISSLAIGFLSISNARQISNEGAEQELSLTCGNKSAELNALISRIEQSVDTLSSIALSNLDFEKFKSNNSYVTKYTESIMNDVVKFGENTDGAISVYVRYNPDFTEPTSGIFLMRNSTEEAFTSVTPTDFTMYDKTDLAHVGWYYIPVENGAPLWMDPYLNENINVYMISYVVPLYVDGVSVGIIGMDIDFTQITDIAGNMTAFDTGYAFLYNSKGSIMYHQTLETGADMTQVGNGALASITDSLLNAGNAGDIWNYSYEGTKKSMSVYPLDNGMYLALTAPDSEIKANADSLSTRIFVFTLVCLGICAVLGILMGNSIAGPIRKVTDIIRDTANLDFRKAVQIDRLMKNRDETGVMAAAVSEMCTVLRELVGNIEQAEESILENMDRLDSIMNENNRISEDNSATTQEMAAGMQETTASTAMMAGNAEAIRQNADGIQSLSRQGQEISKEIMERARQLRETTAASSDRTMNIYEEMKLRTEEAIEQSRAVEKINELTDDIREISSQTNMLALNANIEAARAGEAGRGFAVVATEIGNLAGQTFKTVDGINQIVEEVNAAVKNMTECITTIMDFLSQTVVTDYTSFKKVGDRYESDANTFASSMTQVYDEVTDLNTKIMEIVSTIDNVNVTIGQSAEGVNLIAEKSCDVVSKTAEGYELLKESRECVNRLKAIVDRFQV